MKSRPPRLRRNAVAAAVAGAFAGLPATLPATLGVPLATFSAGLLSAFTAQRAHASAVFASDDNYSTTYMTTLSGVNLLSNDYDPYGGNALTIVGFTQPAHGTANVSSDGYLTYVPAAGYSGIDSFSYATNTTASSDYADATGNVIVRVRPSAANDNFNTPYGTTLSGVNVLFNDGGSALSVSGFSPASHGIANVASDGSLTYVPYAGYNGVDSFVYEATDGYSGATASVNITVLGWAATDSYNTPYQTTLSGRNVLDNDTGANVMSVLTWTPPSHGTANLQSDGSLTYLPASGYSGADSFTYTAYDRFSIASATVNIAVGAAPVVATNDSYSTPYQTTLSGVNVLSNDTPNTASVINFTQPSHGTANVSSSGFLTYVPAAGYSGADSFTYVAYDGYSNASATVNITVGLAPVVAGNDSYSTPYQTTLSGINVLANDSGANTLMVVGFTPASHGTANVASDGSLTYVPAGGYSGADSFTYLAYDGYSNASATVNINVLAAPTPPAPPPPKTTSNWAIADKYITAYQTSLSGRNVLSNDGANTASVVSFTQPSHGTANVSSSGLFTYVPAAGFSGFDSFTYTATDGSSFAKAAVGITVMDPLSVADDSFTVQYGTTLSGVNVLQNDGENSGRVSSYTQPSHGTANVSPDGSLTYVPAPGYIGPDAFQYYATNGVSVVPATVRIQVEGWAKGDAYRTGYGNKLRGNVLTNDIGNFPMRVIRYSTAFHGTVVGSSDGSFTYEPLTGYSGADSFSYLATDGYSNSSGIVNITVATKAQTVVSAADDSYRAAYGTLLNGVNVLDNDSGGPLAVVNFTQPSHGIVKLDSDGSLAYLPDGGFGGTDSFSYTASDGVHSAGATVTISVGANPQTETGPGGATPISAGDDSYTTTRDKVLSGVNVLTNDHLNGSGDSNSLVVVHVTPPSHGTANVLSDGSLTYTPASGYSGTDSFKYVAADQSGTAFAGATVNITVADEQAAPARYTPISAVDDIYGTARDTVLMGVNVLKNDIGGAHAAMRVVGFTRPAHGVVKLDSDGSLAYLPDRGFGGTDSFSYTASDGISNASATIAITIAEPTKDAPAPIPAADDTYSTPYQTPLSGRNVLDNDPGGANSVAVVYFTQPSHGTANVASDGSLTYTPALGYSGTDSFKYVVADKTKFALGGAMVNILVGAAQQAQTAPQYEPISAINNNFSTLRDTVLYGVNVLDNNTGGTANSVAVVSFTQPTHGVVKLDSDGMLGYLPDRGYQGADSFTYTTSDGISNATATVTITVSADPPTKFPPGYMPITTVDDSYRTGYRTPLRGVNVLDNDSLSDGSGGSNSLTVVYFTPRSSHGGVVDVQRDGRLTYTPALDFSGTDRFKYVASNKNQTAFAGATVTITVAADGGFAASPLAAADDSYSTARDTLPGDVNATDGQRVYLTAADPGALLAVCRTLDSNATVEIQSDGSVVVQISGESYTLLFDRTLQPHAPAEHANDAWWQGDDGHFYLKNGDGSVQGFTVK